MRPHFDVALLEQDLERLSGFFRAYVQRDNPINIGEVFVCPLRSPGGDGEYLESTPTELPFQSTSFLDQAPYISKILSTLPSPLFSARLIRIGPLGGLRFHQDNYRNPEHGILRFHIPITSNSRAKLVLLDTIHCWEPGSLWYGDFSYPHRVINFGESERVHLVVDIGVTPELLHLFPEGRTLKNARYQEKPIVLEKPLAQARVFDLPTGFLPQREVGGLASLSCEDSEIKLTVANRQFQLVPIASDRLFLRNAGCGRVIQLFEDSIELKLFGAVKPYRSHSPHIFNVSTRVPT